MGGGGGGRGSGGLVGVEFRVWEMFLEMRGGDCTGFVERAALFGVRT